LGLAIVKRIGELLHHPIKVASRLGKGSKFSIEVPLAAASAGQDGASAPAKLDEAALIGARVVVIDDEADVREAVTVVLKQWGCHVLAAGDANEALARLAAQERGVDLIVSDYRLREGQTGIDAIRALRRQCGAQTPALIITGDTAPDRLREAAAAGYDLLHKPLNPARLKAALARTLARASNAA
jgi:two-component system, sensor histidine kinase